MAKRAKMRLDVSWRRANSAALLAACILAMALLAWKNSPGRYWLSQPADVERDKVALVRQKVDPNADGPASLRRLHQVGPARAKAIADYARLHGPRAFETAEDMMKVKGIGPGLLGQFRDQLALPSATAANDE